MQHTQNTTQNSIVVLGKLMMNKIIVVITKRCHFYEVFVILINKLKFECKNLMCVFFKLLLLILLTWVRLAVKIKISSRQ